MPSLSLLAGRTVHDSKNTIEVKHLALSSSASSPRVWGNRHIFQGNREQRPNFEGNMGAKTILGNVEHKKTFSMFWGTGEHTNLVQGNMRKGISPMKALKLDRSLRSTPENKAQLKASTK